MPVLIDHALVYGLPPITDNVIPCRWILEMFMIVVVGKEGLHSFQYSGLIKPSDQSVVFFGEHSLLAVSVRPFITDELFKFSCTRLSIAKGALSSGNLSIPPDISGYSPISYGL